MRRGSFVRTLLGGVLATAGAHCVLAADRPLAETLAKMDEAASRFKGLSATMTHLSHFEVIHEEEVETGSILMKRPKPKDVHIRLELQKPEPKVVVTDGNKVDVYYPRSGQIDRLELGKRRSLVDMFVAQGFGGTSAELQKDYVVKLGGSEMVNGESATRLELIPKSAVMLEQYKKVELWISDKTGYTLQQKLYENAKDYHLITYSNVKINPEIPDSSFKLDVPKGTKRETLIKK